MSYIPDCRHDEYYNARYLLGKDADFVDGFDWCCEEAMDSFFDNLDMEFGDDAYIGHILNEELPEGMQEEYEWTPTFGDREPETRKVETYGDLLRAKLLDWVESHRDELVTSMIDSMDEKTYKAAKAMADEGK